jgi:hypothetical protein
MIKWLFFKKLNLCKLIYNIKKYEDLKKLNLFNLILKNLKIFNK